MSAPVPKRLTRQEFGQRLKNLMLEQEWNQSELARRAGVGRDSISTYIRGKTLPEPVTLQRLAKALGVTSEELLPNTMSSAAGEDTPAFELRQSHDDPNRVWMRLDRAMSPKLAAKIIEMIAEEDRKIGG